MRILDANIRKQPKLRILYKNYREETAWRNVVPMQLLYGKTEFHPEEQWLLEVHDVDRGVVRTLALKDILTMEVVDDE